MAEGAGQIAIAEGIERPEELERVAAAGFRFGQGYWFARPMPLDQLPELLASPVPWPEHLDGPEDADGSGRTQGPDHTGRPRATEGAERTDGSGPIQGPEHAGGFVSGSGD